MNHEEYFYNCSREYINSIDSSLYDELLSVIAKLTKRQTQSEINNDIFWLLTSHGWAYDTLSGTSELPPPEYNLSEVGRQ